MRNQDCIGDIKILTSEYAVLDIAAGHKFIELDAGCGKGGFACKLALKYPDRTIVATDVMLGRLRRLRNKTESKRISNIQIIRADTRQLAGYMLPDNSVDRIHILCPDPWPKNKHVANRLISSEFLGLIYRILKLEGVFHFSTDDYRYFKTVDSLISQSQLFVRDDTGISDIADMKSDFEIVWHEQNRPVRHAGWVKMSNPHRIISG